jgi:hypothetical protein
MTRTQKQIDSEQHIHTAIAYAPLAGVLGAKAAKSYRIRELSEDDCIQLLETTEQRYYSTKHRTFSLALTLVHRDAERKPLVSFVASKKAGNAKNLTVHVFDAAPGLDSDMKGRAVFLLQLVAQTYGLLAGAEKIVIAKIDKSMTQLFEMANYEVTSRSGLLYATRNILTTITTHQAH